MFTQFIAVHIIQLKRVLMKNMIAVLYTCRCFDEFIPGKCFIIKISGAVACSRILIEMAELDTQNGGLDIVEPRIDTDFIMIILYTLPVVGDHLHFFSELDRKSV